MANDKSGSNSKGLLSSLTGHIASWVAGNTGMSGQAGQALKNRQANIDKQVAQALNAPQPKPKKTNSNGKWPWQNNQ